MPAFRFETRLPLRHTDSFGGTPFVHGGVLLALTEIALDEYDRAAALPSHRDVLRFQSHTEVRYRSALRWDDGAIVRLRCAQVSAGRLRFACEVAGRHPRPPHDRGGAAPLRLRERHHRQARDAGRLAGDRHGDPRV